MEHGFLLPIQSVYTGIILYQTAYPAFSLTVDLLLVLWFQQVAFDEEKVSSTAKKIYSRKIQELAGNDIFRGDALRWSAEKQLSTAKLKEMSGSNIFANGNGKTVTRDYLGGVRKPPGGGSSFAFA